MTTIESAWDKVPGYAIDLVPLDGIGRVRRGDVVVAESERCLVVQESDHRDQLYFPPDDVRWELLTESDHHTVCPFKGEADYWSLTGAGPVEDNVAWSYRRPFDEVAGLDGYVAFYTDRLDVTVTESFGDDPGDQVTRRFPFWGTAQDLVTVMDVRPADDTQDTDDETRRHFVAPPYPDPPIGTFIPAMKDRHPNGGRNVVEAGQLLGDAIVAASKTVPDQRVTSAHLVFSRAAAFDAPVDVAVEILRKGRTFSTLEVRITQHGKLCSAGIVMLDVGADDAMRTVTLPPEVVGPDEAPLLDMGVFGRALRCVDDAYRQTPESVGPPRIDMWTRFRHGPDHEYLHQALLAQSSTHWTIAAAMAPHRGITEAAAHVTLSTGIMTATIAFHDAVDVTEWLRYATTAVYAGRGQAQGQGQVVTRDGRLVASYTIGAMVRGFATEPDAMGKDYSNAM